MTFRCNYMVHRGPFRPTKCTEWHQLTERKSEIFMPQLHLSLSLKGSSQAASFGFIRSSLLD